MQCDEKKQICLFLSTPSARRATRRAAAVVALQYISIHALREEGDARPPNLSASSSNFYPRPPRGGRPALPGIQPVTTTANFYPRPPRGGRPDGKGQRGEQVQISIHALREEGDHAGAFTAVSVRDFYPRPPRGGRPGYCCSWCSALHNFYPRPPRGGRRLLRHPYKRTV